MYKRTEQLTMNAVKVCASRRAFWPRPLSPSSRPIVALVYYLLRLGMLTPCVCLPDQCCAGHTTPMRSEITDRSVHSSNDMSQSWKFEFPALVLHGPASFSCHLVCLFPFWSSHFPLSSVALVDAEESGQHPILSRRIWTRTRVTPTQMAPKTRPVGRMKEWRVMLRRNLTMMTMVMTKRT